MLIKVIDDISKIVKTHIFVNKSSRIEAVITFQGAFSVMYELLRLFVDKSEAIRVANKTSVVWRCDFSA